MAGRSRKPFLPDGQFLQHRLALPAGFKLGFPAREIAADRFERQRAIAEEGFSRFQFRHRVGTAPREGLNGSLAGRE